MATTVESNKDLVRRDIEQIWNDEQYEVIEELYADDFVHHDPAFPGEIRGPSGQAEFVRTYKTAFPGSITIEELVSEGNFVTVRWTGRATHEGSFMGVEPTHNDIEMSGMTLARVEDGQAIEMWSQYDALGLMGQIGAIEPPSE